MFRTHKKTKWLMVAILVVLLGGVGYYFYGQQRASAATQETPKLQTATARRGDLVLSATGSGTLIAAQEVALSFSSEGLLTEIKAQVGAKVKAGDVLARLDGRTARKTELAAQLQLAKAEADLDSARQSQADVVDGPTAAELLSAEAAVKTAEEKVADLEAGATAAELANAEAALAAAQDAYNLVINGPTAEDLEKAQMDLNKAKNSLWASQNSRDEACSRGNSASCDGAKAGVLNAEIAVRSAEMTIADLNAPATATEIKQATATLEQAQETLSKLRTGATKAELASAQSALATAQAALAELRAQPTAAATAAAAALVKQAELTLTQAQLALKDAEQDVEETTLVAPFDGTVTAVTAAVGERVGSTSLITVVDMSTPTLEVYLDETDMDKAVVGLEVSVEFDAIADETFKGKVTRVDPELVTVSNVQVVRVLAALDATSFAKPQQLMLGLGASVDVIGGQAKNAVLVPVEALRTLDEGQYYVFVVENGEPTMRTVQVGLQNITYAEITSGLQAGEVVSTGLVEKEIMNAPLIIETQQLTKVYQIAEMELLVLQGIDLQIAAGEFVAIMGPSGSGKSTLMNILGCLDHPTTGRYLLNGEDVSVLDKQQLAVVRNRRLGFVFQSYNLLSRTTALKNVMLPMLYDRDNHLSVQERRDRAIEALTAVGLEDRLEHEPQELSGGQRQRVAIARALINDPVLILADEPTGNLDTRSGEEIMEILHELHGRGRTIVMVTHEHDIAAHTQRTIHLRDGLIESVVANEQLVLEGAR